jgi:putative aminopeptidase FrvX
MAPKEFAGLAERLMRQPAVAGSEELVQAEVWNICRDHDLRPEKDKFSNILVRFRTDARKRPVALSAHMDHPGFEIVRGSRRGEIRARFRGGVPDRYFRKDIPLRLMPGAIPARLGERNGKQFQIATKVALSSPRFAVWELTDFKLRDGRIYGRACDDLIGVSAVLATIIDLKRANARCNVLGVITRAEEVGFLGALALAHSRGLPKNALVISLETSRELPPVKMGAGVIVRVGDRASIFDSEATRYLTEVATDIQKADDSFYWQRALMSGGACEGTAYQEAGFQTAAVCVALGNYHNCAANVKIAEEFIDLSDACGMVRLLVAACEHIGKYNEYTQRLGKRIEKLRKEALKTLR